MYYDEACMNYPSIILIIEPTTGRIVAANKKAEITYGYSIEKLCTMNINEINALKQNQLNVELEMATTGKCNVFQFLHKTADDKLINMEVDSYPTLINNKVYLFSLISPIPPESIISTSSINLVEESTDSIMIVDQNNKVRKINKSFEKLFDCKETDVIGESAFSLLKGLDLEKYENLVSSFSERGSKKVSFNIADDDKVVEYTLTGIPTFYLDNYYGAVFLIHRNCDQKAVEESNKELIEKKLGEMEKINTENNDFLARMSHDMRTPMNAIIGIATFGMDEIKDPKAHEYFSQIKDSSDYLLALINDILDMQKLESGEIKLNEVITNTPRIAQKVRTIIEPRAAQKGIDLRFDLECENMYRFIKVDERRLEQVIINILNNAIKYTPEGGIVIWRDYATNLPDGRIKVSHEFIDTGVGISSEFQKNMFEPFTSEVNSQSKSEGGSGLGLAITKNLLDKMGGEISCKSKLGKGTTFYMNVYFNPATEEEIEVFLKTSKVEKGIKVIKGKRLLICEDVDINIMILKKMLDVYGCDIDVAKNGLDGVNLARENNYDAILMDIRMPVMNGLEAAKEIRKFSSKVPIIALSANAYFEDIQKSKAAGMNKHLAKPIIREELYSTLSSLLDL